MIPPHHLARARYPAYLLIVGKRGYEGAIVNLETLSPEDKAKRTAMHKGGRERSDNAQQKARHLLLHRPPNYLSAEGVSFTESVAVSNKTFRE